MFRTRSQRRSVFGPASLARSRRPGRVCRLEPLEPRRVLAPLMTDINPGSVASLTTAADPGFTAIGDTVYFATNHDHNIWSWKVGDSAAVEAIDLGAAAGSNTPKNLAAVGNTLVFVGKDSSLWAWNSSSGASQISTATAAQGFVALNGKLLFAASDPTNGNELWITDGTAAGTQLLKDINAGTSDASPTSLTVVDNTVFFLARTAAEGQELWKSDGTAAGTTLVKDVVPGTLSSALTALTAFQGYLYFSTANTASLDGELWRSDGTSAGTALFANLNAADRSNPSDLTVAGNKLFFWAATSTDGRELFVSDGTAAGTHLVTNIASGTASAYPATYPTLGPAPAALGATLIFAATDGTGTSAHGVELWSSDGTAAGTTRLTNFAGTASPVIAQLTTVGPLVYFAATDPTWGREVWQSDGTAAGTRMLADIKPGTDSAGSAPLFLRAAGGALFFSADDGATGREPWTCRPLSADIVDVTPDPRLTSVSSITITFSEKVQSVAWTDFTLSRSGGANLLTAANTLASSDGGQTWVLENLGGITSPAGTYVLSLAASGSNIVDSVGNPLAIGATDSWVKYQQSDLLVDFGTAGLWIWKNNATWQNLHTYNPVSVTTGDLDGNGQADAIVDFGPADGLWVYYNNSTWQRLHTYSAAKILTADLNGDGRDEVIIDFGGNVGTWEYYPAARSWRQLLGIANQGLTAGDLDGNGRKELLADLGTMGLYTLWNDGNWQQLHPFSPVAMITANFDANARQELIVDFGPGLGLWMLNNGSNWQALHSYSTALLAAGDLDGNSRDELIVDFGAGVGVWEYYPATAAWRMLTNVRAARMATGDLDGNGQQELIADLPGYALYVFANNASWQYLHSYHPDGFAVGDLDGSGSATYAPAADTNAADRAIIELLARDGLSSAASAADDLVGVSSIESRQSGKPRVR